MKGWRWELIDFWEVDKEETKRKRTVVLTTRSMSEWNLIYGFIPLSSPHNSLDLCTCLYFFQVNILGELGGD